MSLATAKYSDYARYSVSLSSTSRNDSVLLGAKKGKVIMSTIFKKMAAFVALFMMVAVGFTGLIASAPDARADMMADAINNTFCAGAPLGYSVHDKDMQSPDTKAMTKTSLNSGTTTPYEKYGMSGTTWSVWVGFDANSENSITAEEQKGKGSSKGIVSFAGGNAEKAGLATWNAKLEKNRPAGLWNNASECPNWSPRNFPTQFGNLLLDTAKTTTWIAGFAYQAAADASEGIYTGLEKPVEKIVNNMKDKLYFQYLTPMIMIGAIWMFYVGLVKRRSTEFLSGLLWTVGALAASVVFMTKPMAMPEMVNGVVTGISQGGMASITSYAGSTKDDMCAVDPATSGSADDRAEANEKRSIRQIQCNLWYSFVYTPWTVGQFGHNPKQLTSQEATHQNGFMKRTSSGSARAYVWDRDGVQLPVLTKDNGNALTLQRVQMGEDPAPNAEQNWALYLLDHKVNWDNATQPEKNWKARGQLHVTANQLTQSNYNADFRGDNGQTRIAMGAMAALSSIGAALMIVIISLSIIILDLGIIILALVSPIFFLAALHPGAGRKIAMGWVEMIIKMALKRIALSIFLALMISIFGVLIQSGKEDNWAISMIIIVAVAIGGLMFQKQISDMFNGFSLGGQAMDTSAATNKFSQMGNNMGRSMKSNALGAISGGRLGGHSAVGNLMRDRKDEKKWDKRMAGGGAGGGAGAGGAGETPFSKKEQKASDKETAARNVLQREGYLDTSGAGEAPSGKEQPQVDGGHAGGAGEMPAGADREEIEGNRPDGGAGEVPEGRPMPEAVEGENREQIEGGAGGTPEGHRAPEGIDGPEGEDRRAVEGGAGAAPQRTFQQAASELPSNKRKAAAAAAVAGGAAAVGAGVAAGGRRTAKAVSSNRQASRERRAVTQEKRAEKAFTKQKQSMYNDHYRKTGELRTPTDAEVRSAIDTKRQESAKRQTKLDKGITHVKRGAAATGGAIASGSRAVGGAGATVGRNTKKFTNAAFVEPSRELKNMVTAFNEDTGKVPNKAVAKVSARVDSARNERKETKAYGQLVKAETKTIAKDRKQTAKMEHKEKQQDLKRLPRGTVRNVYEKERYGTGSSTQRPDPKKPTAKVAPKRPRGQLPPRS